MILIFEKGFFNHFTPKNEFDMMRHIGHKF